MQLQDISDIMMKKPNISKKNADTMKAINKKRSVIYVSNEA